MADENMIRLSGLRVLYGTFAAVDGLDLDIRRGELFGLLGPNGAGKSTTIRVLIGQRLPTAGGVTVGGFDVVRDWAKVKPLFGYVPDRENHFEEFTGRRNLEFFAQLYGVPRRRAADCLKLVELDEAGDLPVRGYSLGMRKKLLLARALLHEPPVLYLDEPTANLDIHSAEVVHRILRERVKHGATVILTTHDMDEVERICDRVGIVCRGKLVALDVKKVLLADQAQCPSTASRLEMRTAAPHASGAIRSDAECLLLLCTHALHSTDRWDLPLMDAGG